jgi:biopolymer transport protein ExbB/TolQ
MSISEFHSMGGIQFMLPLSLCLLLNLGIIGVCILSVVRAQPLSTRKTELIKQVGIFALAWGAFGTLVALFAAFGDISTRDQEWTWQIIAGGLKVGLITVLYGLGIFLFSTVILIILNTLKKSNS